MSSRSAALLAISVKAMRLRRVCPTLGATVGLSSVAWATQRQASSRGTSRFDRLIQPSVSTSRGATVVTRSDTSHRAAPRDDPRRLHQQEELHEGAPPHPSWSHHNSKLIAESEIVATRLAAFQPPTQTSLNAYLLAPAAVAVERSTIPAAPERERSSESLAEDFDYFGEIVDRVNHETTAMAAGGGAGRFLNHSSTYFNSKWPYFVVAVGKPGSGKSHTQQVLLEQHLGIRANAHSPAASHEDHDGATLGGTAAAASAEEEVLLRQREDRIRLSSSFCILNFHFSLDPNGQPAESVGLCSDPSVRARTIVLISPNFPQRRKLYEAMGIATLPLQLDWRSLTSGQLLRLMHFVESRSPLYAARLMRILRDQQRKEQRLTFAEFQKKIFGRSLGHNNPAAPKKAASKSSPSSVIETLEQEFSRQLNSENLSTSGRSWDAAASSSPLDDDAADDDASNTAEGGEEGDDVLAFGSAQLAFIFQRMELLASLIHNAEGPSNVPFLDFDALFGRYSMVVVDLSDPLYSVRDANTILAVVYDQFRQMRLDPKRHGRGKVVAFDEAHQFLESGSDLAAELDKSVKLLRHEGMRVILSTQSPDVVPTSMLELCSMVLIHNLHRPRTWEKLQRELLLPKDAMARISRMPPGQTLACIPSGSSPFAAGATYGFIQVRNRRTADLGRTVAAAATSVGEPHRRRGNRRSRRSPTKSLGDEDADEAPLGGVLTDAQEEAAVEATKEEELCDDLSRTMRPGAVPGEST